MSHAAWTVPADHPAFAGHFPGRPIVPGVILLDRAIQFAAAESGRESAVFGIASAKFLSPVGPGETLAFTLVAGSAKSVRFDIASGDRPVATGTLSLADGA